MKQLIPAELEVVGGGLLDLQPNITIHCKYYGNKYRRKHAKHHYPHSACYVVVEEFADA